MPGALRARRDALCDLLDSLTDEQWQAETLCGGWDAGDVAAHLIVREREPMAAPGIVLGGPLAAFTEHRRLAVKRQGRAAMIARLRSGPPWPFSGPLGDVQVTEDWIHEQDVRRGGAGLPTPAPDERLDRRLWGAATRFAARSLSLDGDAVVELADGTRSHRVRSRRLLPVALPTGDAPDVTVTGAPADLLLWVAGRAAAQVEITGAGWAQELLRRTSRAV